MFQGLGPLLSLLGGGSLTKLLLLGSLSERQPPALLVE